MMRSEQTCEGITAFITEVTIAIGSDCERELTIAKEFATISPIRQGRHALISVEAMLGTANYVTR